jgi:very-short-patch-repair endonuclease
MVDIICPIHGEFSQMVKSHMNGSSCRKCSQVEVAKKLKGVKKVNLLDKETIINRLMNIYDYDYSECDIKGTRNNAIISNVKCPIHGYFTKRLSNHLRLKQGCNLCGTNKSNITDFINKSNIIHQNKYDYNDSVYINDRTKIIIKCPVHGDFLQNPTKHLSGQGCPTCYKNKASKGETFIEKFLLDNNIQYESQKIIPGTKQKMDFYLPLFNMCIEYDGIQHFEPRSVFGGEVEYKSQIDRDKRKDEYCISNNIKIIRIGYKDFTKLDSILTKLLLKESRIYDYTNFVTFYMV